VDETVPGRGARVQDRFGLLLVLIVASFVTLGASNDTWARELATALQFAALIVAFLSTALIRAHRWLGLFALAEVLALLLTPSSSDVSDGIAAIAGAAVLLILVVAVLDRVLRHKRVTVQTLYGATCAYLLIGLTFSSIYAAFDALGSQPLFGETVPNSVYSYFSFVTLTTLGFGDYTAKTALAQRFVALEAVIGQLFLATTLARLVSLYKSAADT